MSQLTAAVITDNIIHTEPHSSLDNLEQQTVDDYKALNDKLDKAINKIKGRKSSKKNK